MWKKKKRRQGYQWHLLKVVKWQETSYLLHLVSVERAEKYRETLLFMSLPPSLPPPLFFSSRKTTAIILSRFRGLIAYVPFLLLTIEPVYLLIFNPPSLSPPHLPPRLCYLFHSISCFYF